MTERGVIGEAIRECIKLWDEIKKSGKSKFDFLYSPDGQVWRDKDYENNCPLCEVSSDNCSSCPLIVQYDKGCDDLGFREDSLCKPSFFEAIRGLKE